MPKPPSIDLHVHSNYSDGRLSPDELAARAVLNRVTTLAITDHDTMAGVEEKRAACRRHGIECVDGVEISCELDGRETHILSLFADPASKWLRRIDEVSGFRERRMEKMLEKLSAMGIAIRMEELPVAANGVYGRPHLARVLVARKIVKSVNEAFARLLYDGGPVHVAKERLPAAEGIGIARRMGGLSILAHPGVSRLVDDVDRLADMGLDGVEVYHPKHGGETIARLLRRCRERGLLVSGGSDFHGPGDGADIGAARVPADLMEPLREAATARKG